MNLAACRCTLRRTAGNKPLQRQTSELRNIPHFVTGRTRHDAAAAVTTTMASLRYRSETTLTTPTPVGDVASCMPGSRSFAYFTTKTGAVAAADDNINYSEEPEIVLFQRKINTSLNLMRSGFCFSTAHTAYWIWYTTDFIPTVNAAALHDLHVDPMVGVAGICFAAALQTAFMIYPKRLVSKLTYRPQSQKIAVYTHRLPFMRANVHFPSASFPVGTHNERLKKSANGSSGVDGETKKEDESTGTKQRTSSSSNIKYFKLDASSPEAVQIVTEFKGDLTKHRGHLQVGQSWPRYALDIRSPEDVPEPELLLEALLRPEHFGYNLLPTTLPQQKIMERRGSNNNKIAVEEEGDVVEYATHLLGKRFKPNNRNRKRPGRTNRRR